MRKTAFSAFSFGLSLFLSQSALAEVCSEPIPEIFERVSSAVVGITAVSVAPYSMKDSGGGR